MPDLPNFPRSKYPLPQQPAKILLIVSAEIGPRSKGNIFLIKLWHQAIKFKSQPHLRNSESFTT
jgi:hypothetical protein